MRTPLPDRRPSATTTVTWEGHTFPVSIGLDPETGRPLEVFADVAQGGQFQWAVADACVIISLALQHGIAPADLAKSLGRVPGLVWDKEAQAMVEVLLPASPLGAIVQILEQENEK